jgi:hypothetical protein
MTREPLRPFLSNSCFPPLAVLKLLVSDEIAQGATKIMLRRLRPAGLPRQTLGIDAMRQFAALFAAVAAVSVIHALEYTVDWFTLDVSFQVNLFLTAVLSA